MVQLETIVSTHARSTTHDAHGARLRSESTPSPASRAPESRFTQRSRAGVSARRKNPTVPLSKSHHSADPKKTPPTMRMADPRSPAVVPSPRLAKTAAKERIVVGLVSVSASVEPTAAANPRATTGFAATAG